MNKDRDMSRVLLIIPAYNEATSLKNLINEIKGITEKCLDMDYLVINDCSTDSSKSLLENIGANYVSAPVNLGIGGAVQLGYRYAYENGYDIAVQVDGDGQHDPSYINDIVRTIEQEKADCVIGSRFLEKKGFQSSGTRRLGINFLSMLIRIVCGCKVKDVTSGFRGVNRRYIEVFANSYPDDYPEPEVIVTAKLMGARIIEIPVTMRERSAGVSSINLKKSVYYMLKVSIAILMCRLCLGFRRSK